MVRKYGKAVRKTRAEQLFAELPKSPLKRPDTESQPRPKPALLTSDLVLESDEKVKPEIDDSLDQNDIYVVDDIASHLASVVIADSHDEDEDEDENKNKSAPGPRNQADSHSPPRETRVSTAASTQSLVHTTPLTPHHPSPPPLLKQGACHDGQEEPEYDDQEDDRILTWDDVCPIGNTIQKIAEASYAEVYRITNDRGTSIIKVIRLPSPIKPQTKTQQLSGLVDEEPHSEEDLAGELQISEWLADVPGFVVYKERYVVQGKAPKTLLETHQAFHRKMKRQDPDRLQFYPSPSRYLDTTKFLVIELGDAGTALEDFVLDDIDQVWDIFLHTAIALARAEELVEFEHRDLHEGNLCIRQASPPKPRPCTNDSNDSTTTTTTPRQFGHSGLEITILDYGLSRASSTHEQHNPTPPTIFSDLEKDLTLFSSTHAPQCAIYRQMRTYLLSGQTRPSRKDPYLLNPDLHDTPYAPDPVTGLPISWREHHPYTNVLWLAYLYQFLTRRFIASAGRGRDKIRRAEGEVETFLGVTGEMWRHLDPGVSRRVLSFSCAVDVVRYAVEAGWVGEEQLVEFEEGGDGRSMLSFVGDSYGDGESDASGEDGGKRSITGSVAKTVAGDGGGEDDGIVLAAAHPRGSPRKGERQRKTRKNNGPTS